MQHVNVLCLKWGTRYGPHYVNMLYRGDAAAEWVRLSVWDTGIGISQENRSRLFRHFVQLDGSRTRSYGGTGLGLALVKRLAELHGGSVEVESAAGQGSRFTITLPWHPAGAPVD